MAPRWCVRCGAPNPPTAAFCEHCGTPIPNPPSTPLPSSALGVPGLPPPAWGAPQYGVQSTAPPRRRWWVWIIVSLVVVVLVFGVSGFLFLPAAAAITVTGINFESPDDACGLNGATDSGFNASTGQSVGFTYQISGPNASSGSGTVSCTLSGITTSTQGFSVSGANVPLSIPANSTQLFSFNVTAPSAPYTGVLTLVIT